MGNVLPKIEIEKIERSHSFSHKIVSDFNWTGRADDWMGLREQVNPSNAVTLYKKIILGLLFAGSLGCCHMGTYQIYSAPPFFWKKKKRVTHAFKELLLYSNKQNQVS